MNDIFENLEKIILITTKNIFHIYNIESNKTELIWKYFGKKNTTKLAFINSPLLIIGSFKEGGLACWNPYSEADNFLV